MVVLNVALTIRVWQRMSAIEKIACYTDESQEEGTGHPIEGHIEKDQG
jgi:hypothetical protein